MAAERRILGDMVDNDGLPGAPDLVEDGGLDLELAARLKSELNVIENRAGDPSVLGHARDRGKAHPRRAADDVENCRNGVDARDRVDVGLQFVTQRHDRTGLTRSYW